MIYRMLVFKVLKNIDLVYRGGSLGLMGLISQAIFDGGRHVLGYDLQLLFSLSFLKNGYFNLILLIKTF